MKLNTNHQMKVMKKSATGLLLFAVFLAGAGQFSLPASAQAAPVIIYEELFPGPSSSVLDGKSPTVAPGSETWSADLWRYDGTVTASASSSSLTRNAFLPFSPEAGKVYTLTATVSLSTANNAWVALGFVETATVGSGFATSAVNAAPYMFMRSSDNTSDAQQTVTVEGPLTTGLVADVDNGASQDLRLVLDTTNASWDVTFYVNDLELRTISYTTNPTINYVGFGVNAGSNGRTSGLNGTIDNFQLTVIPEPSSTALVGIGLALAGFLSRRGSR